MKPTIVISEDGMFSSEPMSVIEICNLCCAALTGAVQDIRPNYKDEPDAKKIDKELFDALNYSFSKCLELTFPEYELHPEITEEVPKKEEALIKERASKLSSDTPDIKPEQVQLEVIHLPEVNGNEENSSEVH